MRRTSSRERRSSVEQALNIQYDDGKSNGGRKFSELAIYVALISLFSCTNRTDADCSLDFTLYPYSPSPSCPYATTTVRWRGLEIQPGCMGAYVAFAEALAVRANHSSSPIFLDTEEMLACRRILIQDHSELEHCSFYEFSKLEAGFCYNESVDDIGKKLGMQLNSLQTICNGTLKDWDNMSNSTACTDCYGNFIKETGFLNNLLSGEINVTEDVQDCGLALFIAMGASRINDYHWIPSLSRCMVYQHLDNGTNSYQGKEGVNLAAIIVVVAMVGFVAIVVVLVVYISRPKCIKKRKAGEGKTKTKALGSDGSYLISFSSEEVLNAMNYTSPWAFLGEGSAGKVYKGKLPSGQFIAIKHISKNISQVDAFEKEIETISKIRHKNMVSLLGYCDEDGEKCFVYEYCANGNLSQFLLGLQGKELTWNKRVQIAYDSVLGLRFLHLYPDGCIIHRDIKPTNILLTESMEAKLADFGLLKMLKIKETNVFTAVKGTLGYLDPEYASKGRVTCSSDIYSFGVVLLQLLSGRRAIDLNQSHRESLVKKAQKVSQGNPIDPSEYADPRLNGEYSAEAFVILLKLAVLCTASSSQGRPRIPQVYEEIEKALKVSKESSNLLR